MNANANGVGRQVAEGELLWTPGPERIAAARLTQFTQWLDRERGLQFDDYQSLWEWSVRSPEAFWAAIWDHFEVMSDTPYTQVMSQHGMPGCRWFTGSRTNYAEHLLRHERTAKSGQVVFSHSTETRPLATMSWQALGSRVRRLATTLRAMGIKPGDCIVSYMPNVPETAIAMLATTAIGAVWSSAAPEFGANTVIERFSQIEPKLIFAADGYSFGGKVFDRRDQIAAITENIPSIRHVVWLPYMQLEVRAPGELPTTLFEDMLAGADVTREAFAYERVASDHPLWVLFSSGTTGQPKAIVHSHVGMIAEHLKAMALHCNLGPSSTMFFYSTTGWMMWNSVIAALITGASAVLYDGSPVFGGVELLWKMAQDTGCTFFGASPTLVQNMKQAGLVPKEKFDFSAMDAVLVGGAPSTPEIFQWFYDAVKDDLLVGSQSGGTEICSGLVCAVPTQPVYAGEIQARGLGMDVHVWDGDGNEIFNEVGELMVLIPSPSMPLYFANDVDGQRYHDSYFDTFPGIWRHGDLTKINSRGGVYIYGRSDATLNRFGVRIGSAEIYRVLEKIDAIKDSLVICCELPDGGYYMPLFVSLKPNTAMSDELQKLIVKRLRDEASPRHVPDEIHLAPNIPYTLTGKKMEVPVRKLAMGWPPAKAASRDAMADPTLLDWYVAFANRPELVEKRTPKLATRPEIKNE
jgi:acetoacetyl-CoA synthetase